MRFDLASAVLSHGPCVALHCECESAGLSSTALVSIVWGTAVADLKLVVRGTGEGQGSRGQLPEHPIYSA